MKCFRSLFVLTFSLLKIPELHAQTKKLATAEATDHIGNWATVAGTELEPSGGVSVFCSPTRTRPPELWTAW
jgi:hypothetical protein